MFVKTRIRSTSKQLKMLVDYMTTNPRLAHGDFRGPQGRRQEMRQWEELRAMLKEHGPDKSVDQWKVTWRDMRRKALQLASSVNRATGNAVETPALSEINKKILGVMDTEGAFGIPSGEESSIGSPTGLVTFDEVVGSSNVSEEIIVEVGSTNMNTEEIFVENTVKEEIPSDVDESTCQEVPGCSEDSLDTPNIQEREAAKKTMYSRKRHIKSSENMVNKVKVVEEMVLTPMANNELNDNEFGIFGRGVAAQLNAMPLMVAIQAQSHIQNYLTSLRMNSLTNQLKPDGYTPSLLSQTPFIASLSPSRSNSFSAVYESNDSTENLEVRSPKSEL